MFVKFVYKRVDDKGKIIVSGSAIYECDKLYQDERTVDKTTWLSFHMCKEGKSIDDVSLNDKDFCDVYVMNNNGKTIDTVYWRCEENASQ